MLFTFSSALGASMKYEQTPLLSPKKQDGLEPTPIKNPLSDECNFLEWWGWKLLNRAGGGGMLVVGSSNCVKFYCKRGEEKWRGRWTKKEASSRERSRRWAMIMTMRIITLKNLAASRSCSSPPTPFPPFACLLKAVRWINYFSHLAAQFKLFQRGKKQWWQWCCSGSPFTASVTRCKLVPVPRKKWFSVLFHSLSDVSARQICLSLLLHGQRNSGGRELVGKSADLPLDVEMNWKEEKRKLAVSLHLIQI